MGFSAAPSPLRCRSLAASLPLACRSPAASLRPCFLILSALVLTGCRPDAPALARAADIEYALGDYYFKGPDTLPAGRINLRLKLESEAPHVLEVLRLEGGKRMPDLMAAGEGAYDSSWVGIVGGGITAPGDPPSYSLVLEPGVYVLLCYFHTDGAPHFAKGMIKEIVVRGPVPATIAAAPEPDIQVDLISYGFNFSRPLSAGRLTLRVVNPSPHPHEIIFARLKDGMTIEAARAWADSGQAKKGGSPWVNYGGVNLEKGDTLVMAGSFPAGTYRAACFYKLPGDPANHAEMGMESFFEVH